MSGLLLMLLALGIVGMAEYSQRKAVLAFDAIGGPILEIDARGSLADLDGRLVRVQGVVEVDQPAHDREFGVSAATPMLLRTVEMQQWRELRDTQGNVTYARNWFDHPIDSSRFRQPAGHENPPFPFQSLQFKGGAPHIGGLMLGPAIAGELRTTKRVAPDFSILPANLTATFRLDDGMLWSNTHPGSPRIGDLRVGWTMHALEDLSIIARVEHHMLVPASHLPAPGYVLMVGDVPLDTMLPGLPHMPTATWLWRILGLVLAIGGAWLVLAMWYASRSHLPLVIAAGVLPVALVAASMWLGARWSVVIGWLLPAVLAVAVLVWILRLKPSFGSR